MLASELRLLLMTSILQLEGLNCFGVSSLPPLDKQQFGFLDRSCFSAALTFLQVRFVPVVATVLESKLVLGRMEFRSHPDTLSS